MTTSRDVLTSSPDICRGQISWDYDRAEIIADGVVHAIGVCLGLIGSVTIVVIAVKLKRIEVAPILVRRAQARRVADPPAHYLSRKLLRILDRLGCLSLRSALASI